MLAFQWRWFDFKIVLLLMKIEEDRGYLFLLLRFYDSTFSSSMVSVDE